MKRSLVATALVCATLTAWLAFPAIDRSRHAPIDTVIDKAIAKQRIVGAVVLVASHGRIVFERAAGYADRERGERMDMDTVFRFASLTKPIVSVAAMRLVEQHRIGLDDPVSRWLPSFKPQLPDGDTPAITIHQLLTHTAGLSYAFLQPDDGPYRKAGVSDGLDQPDLTLHENLSRIASVPLDFRPGTRWQYSIALDVLGAAMESATRETLPQIVQQQVTNPLAMNATGFRVDASARLATPYQDGSRAPVRMASEAAVRFGTSSMRFTPARIYDAHAYPSGGAGMAGTAPDFMRFLLALRASRLASDGLLEPQTIALMMRDHVGPQAQAQGPGWGFGYGWAVLDDPVPAQTPQARGTIGWGGAYGHAWFFDPVNDLIVVALTNTAFEGASGAFPRALRDAVYRAYGPSLAARRTKNGG
ncbi:MAG TPA: serine hydrolase domain-containing protein [Paraburkholderia sp.]|jgi:CubicO group peptidase (beta-lactamase class C family)|nr:serine hydrolase domain-containing protein [Paraburkholderia sp.]